MAEILPVRIGQRARRTGRRQPLMGCSFLGESSWEQRQASSEGGRRRQRVVGQERLEDCPPVTPPRVESPGRLGELPEHGPPSRYEVERVLLGYDVLRWSTYAEFREAVRLEAEIECMVDTLVDTHLVHPNLPE